MLLLVPAWSWSTTILVTPGPGTPLQDAIDAAPAGAKILTQGDFSERVVISKRLKLMAKSPPGTDIQASSTDGAFTMDIEADGVQVKGIAVTGGSEAAIHVGAQTGVKLDDVQAQNSPHALQLENSSGVKLTNSRLSGNQVGAMLSGIPLGAKIQLKDNFIIGSNTASVLIENSGAGAPLGKGGIVLQMKAGFGGIGDGYGPSAGMVISNSAGVFVKGGHNSTSATENSVIEGYPALTIDAGSQNNRFLKVELISLATPLVDSGTGDCGDSVTYFNGTLPPCP
jgi:hypothetical protein